MTKRRVAITGMGQISPLSLSLDGLWDSLQAGRGGVLPFSLPGSELCPIQVAAPALFSGNIDEFDSKDAGQKKAIKKGLKVMSREIQMAVAASCRALNHADIHIGQFPAERVGISFGSDYILTTVDDLLDGFRACCKKSADEKSFEFQYWAQEGLTKMPPLWQLKYLPNMPSSHIAILNQFHGPSNSMTLREASIGAVVGESVSIIASGRVDVMLVGTTGSRIHPLKLINAIQQEELAPEECRPFDRNRQGTLLGEGAGALVLEEWEHAQKRGAMIWGEVLAGSYRIRFDKGKTDLRHQAVAAVLKDVLNRAEMAPEAVGHISAHGHGNQSSDIAEGAAINDVFGNRKQPIPVTATKGFFGNLGAGTGTIELIAGVLALEKGNLYPSIHFDQFDPLCMVSPTKDNQTPAGDSFIKIAMNQQGQASAVLIKKPN